MNERIQELYREAEKSVAFLSNSKESKQLIIREKFAELIVEKCASKVTRNQALNIFEHFGVEQCISHKN